MQQLSLWTPQSSERSFVVHRASRTERLADLLAHNLRQARPLNPLQSQLLVVAHTGLRRWLLGEFSRPENSPGGHGIAANLEMILPWQWLERTARTVLGEGATSGAYGREHLRWHVFAGLSSVEDAQVLSYLQGGDGERRRFQLAEHLASVFEQYLIYRPDWILDWEKRAQPRDWQAQLWRRVHAAIGQQHRAQRRDRLLQALLQNGDGEKSALHVFGVNHLPPDVLAALRAAAKWRNVHVYFPDPCREHWVYFKSQRAQIRQAAEPQAQYFEVGHPLLAALGRMAQDFCVALEDEDDSTQRDALDEAEPPQRFDSLLAALQSSVRCAQPELIGAEFRAAMARLPQRESSDYADAAHHLRQRLFAQRGDASLRVHACHTRLRELEVLRDALLGFLADDDTLTHGDIVVMAPDISAYAASLPAVFGAVARHEGGRAHIPWHLADVTLARSHPLISAFLRILDLRESRFTVSEVMDFLDVPALARRFGIDASGRAQIEHALRRAHVAWGLDATMKAQAGGAKVAANSWQFGFDRLYAGYLLGDDASGGDAVFEDILPAAGVNGSAAEALGRMDHLIETLREIRDGMMQPRPLVGWSTWLRQRIDALFRDAVRDDAEAAALAALYRVVSTLQEQTDAAGIDTLLPWSVMRDVMRAAIDTVSERQPFLYGGVTFCGMVPQRSIPFRVVCLLGMNEGEFPRVIGDAGINRMLEKPRRGDRDTRNEDRYLFLEALMSARRQLHISYIGTDVRSAKPRNPATPLAELLQLLDEQHALAGSDEQHWLRPWLVCHPPQPFDRRYYQYENERDTDDVSRHDPRLFSFREVFAHLPAQATQDARPFLTFEDTCRSAEGDDAAVSLAVLKRFWKDPAKAILRDSAGVSLQAFSEDGLPDREPLDASVDRRERIELQLVLQAIDSCKEVPLEPPPWLAFSGILAAGPAGGVAYEQARACADAAMKELRILQGAQRAATTVEVPLSDGRRLVGKVEDVYRSPEGKVYLFGARLSREANFGDLLPFFIDWAALVLGGVTEASACFVENATKKNSSKYKSPLRIARPALIDAIVVQTREQLRHGLQRLIAAREAAFAQPLVFPGKTAWEWANAGPERRDSEARAAWEGGFNSTGEREYGGYANLLVRNMDFIKADSAAHARFAAAVELAALVLDPQRLVLLPSHGAVRNETAEMSQDDE
jgi:exodeoxyribonuclease V gamma subunit